MRILHFITSLDPDGAQMTLFKLLSRSRGDVEHAVAMLRVRGAVAERIEALGVRVHRIGLEPMTRALGAVRRLASVTRAEAPDVIQGWMYHGNLAAQLAGLLAAPHAPVVWNIRGTHVDLGREKPGRAASMWLGARLSTRPARIVTNSLASSLLHEQRLGYCRSRTALIPNGFDTGVFVPCEAARRSVRAELGLEPRAPLVGLVKRYHPDKDFATFLRAAALLGRRRKDMHVLLAGEGVVAENAALCGLVRSLGLGGRVHMLGRRDDTPRIQAALDVAVSSSLSEGFPSSVGEAMSCGVPCVVTDVGDTSWFVGDTGIVVPAGSPEALGAGLVRMFEAGPRRRVELGEAARLRVVLNFSLERVVGMYEDLYCSLAAPRCKEAA